VDTTGSVSRMPPESSKWLHWPPPPARSLFVAAPTRSLAGWYVFRLVPGTGGVYVASVAVRARSRPRNTPAPLGLPARSWMPPGLRRKRTRQQRRTPHR
jgi:hypothetical protein